ncbi:hypothetical protein A9U98_21265, partial [Salmonella enterica subsp. enterica serovar Heidelberg]|nr:hypothetical protein [Salmonella enterica subsp. enterica serovar Heidelberg]
GTNTKKQIECLTNFTRVNFKTLTLFSLLDIHSIALHIFSRHLLYDIALVQFSHLMTKLHILKHLLKIKPPKIFIMFIVV